MDRFHEEDDWETDGNPKIKWIMTGIAILLIAIICLIYILQQKSEHPAEESDPAVSEQQEEQREQQPAEEQDMTGEAILPESVTGQDDPLMQLGDQAQEGLFYPMSYGVSSSGF